MRVDTLVHDLVISVRMLRRTPAFTLTIIATVALGIGATSLILAVFDTVVLRALPFPEPDRLLSINATLLETPRTRSLLSLGDVAALRTRSRGFSGFATYRFASTLDLTTGTGDVEPLPALRVSSDFFSILGAQPALGRTLGPADAEPGRDHVVVLSHTVWQQQFAAAPDAVGRSITLNRAPYLVVGVMRADLQFPMDGGLIYLPQPMTTDAIAGSSRDHNVIGRLRPGMTIEAASGELRAIAKAMLDDGTEWVPDFSLAASPLRDRVLGSTTTILRMLAATVLFVLLTACANVAGLLILRSASRQRERPSAARWAPAGSTSSAASSPRA